MFSKRMCLLYFFLIFYFKFYNSKSNLLQFNIFYVFLSHLNKIIMSKNYKKTRFLFFTKKRGHLLYICCLYSGFLSILFSSLHGPYSTSHTYSIIHFCSGNRSTRWKQEMNIPAGTNKF